jgi:DNA-binding MarR family transcriptional regulator
VYKVRELSKPAKKVYLYLSAIADADGYCFPFYKTIAARSGMSSSSVGKAIKELESRGLLARQQRVSRRGGSSNLYHVRRIHDS